MFILNNCSICGSKKNQIIYKQNFKLLKNSHNLFWSHYHSEKKKYNYNIVKCSNCGHIFSNPIFDKKNLKKLYLNSKFDNTWKEEEKTLKKNYYGYYLNIKKFLNIKNDILEIGSDTGILTKIIYNEKFKKITCIEPNIRSFKNSKKYIGKNRNIKFYNNFYEEISHKLKKYDNIIIIHVFDHVININNFLERIKKNLKENAKVHIVVHDIESILSKLLKKKFPPINVQHINFFSQKSLSRLLIKHKFKVIDINKTKNVYSLKHYLESSPFNFKILKSFIKSTKLSNFELGLKLGNFMITAELNK